MVKNLDQYLSQFEVVEISIITYYEITSGLLAKNALKQLEIFEAFVSENSLLPLTVNSVKISSGLYAKLKVAGNIIDDIDLLIAGIAIDDQMALTTNNDKHFKRIPGLKTQNWKKAKV